jgi:hypothetical protein
VYYGFFLITRRSGEEEIMTTHRRTTVAERNDFTDRHAAGESYEEIAEDAGWSHQARDGGRIALDPPDGRKARGGPMSTFPGVVRYCFLRIKLETIERQWARYRDRLYPRYRKRRPRYREPRLDAPTEAHERWKADFKEWVYAEGVGYVNIFNMRDEVSAVKTGSFAFLAGASQARRRVSLREAQAATRQAFAHWGLCDRFKTDRDPVLVSRSDDPFPTTFILWLTGLGVRHEVATSAVDNSEVERFHRTWYARIIMGQRFADLDHLQVSSDHELRWINHKLPSRAKDCRGRPPLVAHPEALQPRRPYAPEWEVELFSMQRVYAYLAERHWWRAVSKVGQISLGGQRYGVGIQYARQDVRLTFDLETAEFIVWNSHGAEIKRLTPKSLTMAEITGLDVPSQECD